MISNILSQFFRLLFVLSVFGGLYATITSVRSKDSAGWYGQRGIEVVARATYYNLNAPSTVIRYQTVDSSGNKILKEGSFSEVDISDSINPVAFLENSAKENGHHLIVDSQFSVIAERKNETNNFFSSARLLDSLSDGKSVYIQTFSNREGKVIKTIRDTFPNIYSGRKAFVLKEYSVKNEFIQKGNITEKLRMLPASTGEKIIFFFYILIKSATLSFLFYTLTALFKNFSNHIFFNAANCKLILRAGWLILIPEILSLIFYCIFLWGQSADKIKYSSSSIDSTLIANYQFESGVDYLLLTLGLGLIVLAYIFKQGLELEEEAALTV